MRRPDLVFLALLIALLVTSLPTAVALAQLPQFPNTFYGDITVNGGDPAPVGMVVTAVADRGVSGTEKRYSVTITEAGIFGSPNGLKLKVGGDSQGVIANGSNIEFFLSTGPLPDNIVDLDPVEVTPFVDDGNPHVLKLDLVGGVLDSTGTPPPPPPPPDSTSTPTPDNGQPRLDDNDDGGSGPIPTANPPATTPTNPTVNPSEGGGGGQPVPTNNTPVPDPSAEPLEPTPVVVVVAPPQVPTPTEVPAQTPEPTPTQGQPPVPTLVPPTPTVSLEIDEPIIGGGGEDGGFPWWGWVLLVLVFGAAAGGVALYFLRT